MKVAAEMHSAVCIAFALMPLIVNGVHSSKGSIEQSTSTNANDLYQNIFVVQVPKGDEAADFIAAKLGFINRGQIGSMNYFKLLHPLISKRSLENNSKYLNLLNAQKTYGNTWNGMDMNVLNAWQRGYTGKGIYVAIVDDGVDRNHPDLINNYDPRISSDLTDSMPDQIHRGHGTALAQIVAATPFNGYCNTGIAFNASIGGINILGANINDATEAAGLSYQLDLIDIYSLSWGPVDNGVVFDGPGTLAKLALSAGTTFGRGGKGSIYVHASGNGGVHDCCGADGYATSIHTITISSATDKGRRPWHLEECSATLATAYGSAFSHERASEHNKSESGYICASEYSGTSAAAAVASGIIALMLDANPRLIWRDVQHLIVLTSQAAPLRAEPGWLVNGVNKSFSHAFGFGLLDAEQLVLRAHQWTTIPKQRVCASNDVMRNNTVSKKTPFILNLLMDGCSNTLNEVRFLEHIQLKMNVIYEPRGNLNVELTSPMGTTSVLLKERPNDSGANIDMQWPLMSVHFWGEPLKGQWRVHISTDGKQVEVYPGLLINIQLLFYGTMERPVHIQNMDFNSKSKENKNAIFDLKGYNEQKIYKRSNTRTKNNKQIELLLYGDPNIKEKEEAIANCSKNCPLSNYCLKSQPSSCISCKHLTSENTANEPLVCWLCGNKCNDFSAPQRNDSSSKLKSLKTQELRDRMPETCPPRFFEVPELVTCSECSPNCLTCVETANKCTSCAEELFMFGNKCYSTCPQGTYAIKNKSCATCHQNCKTCIQWGWNQCVTCNDGLYQHNGSCLETCPNEYYPKNGQCEDCAVGCEACRDRISCSRCKANWMLLKGTCVYSADYICSEGNFYNGSDCLKCHDTCAKCSGGTYKDCITCKADRMLEATRCVSKCSNGYIREENACVPCAANCERCLTKNECTACNAGLLLQGTVCGAECAPGYFPNYGKCETCFPTCVTCSGPRKSQCVSCPQGWNLLDGQCQIGCPESYFQAQFGCNHCYHDCKTCQGPETNDCSSCPPNYTLLDGKCLTCVFNTLRTYFNSATEVCEDCHKSCERCNGPLANHCTECARPFQLDINSGHCLPCCSEKFIILESLFMMTRENASIAINKPFGCCLCDKHKGSCNASSAIADTVTINDLDVFIIGSEEDGGKKKILEDDVNSTPPTPKQTSTNSASGIKIVLGSVCLISILYGLRKLRRHIRNLRNRNLNIEVREPVDLNTYSIELGPIVSNPIPELPRDERPRRFGRNYLDDGTVSE